ncbi:MAG TPA: hypothetical protein VN442_19800 [Bryobacteraceae bacterium]|nr:hypothetical protein [Bryobacteraceae bacterium]
MLYRILLCGILLLAPVMGANIDLFSDDFSRYPAGWLSAPIGIQGGAIQEYHYLPHRGVPLGPWGHAICHLDAWAAGEEDGAPYMEQQLTKHATFFATPIFITGDEEWNGYAVEAKVRPLALDDMAGVVFRYHTNHHYYLFALTEGNTARLVIRGSIEKGMRVDDWRELANAPFPYDTTRYYHLRVENDGTRIRAYINGRKILEAEDREILKGKAGIAANVPTRFREFRVSAPQQTAAAVQSAIRGREQMLARLRDGNPRPKLWKKFATPGFGAGRNARFGDLDGDGVADMLIGQSVRKPESFALSCLTAVTLDGKVLWQSGRPNPDNALLTTDTPFQIHDVDGDGRNEVVVIRDYRLQILDGKTGQLKHWIWMPKAPERKAKPYELSEGNAIAFLNISGDPGRREILVKDQYERFWVFDRTLKLLWEGAGQLGHYPYPVDIDGDGRDEIAIGYALWDHDGRLLWSRDREVKDHADGVAVGNFSGDPQKPPRVFASGSDEGFLLFDIRGNLLKHVRLGHNQSPSIGKFRPDLPGLQYFSINFWRNPGIITLLDWEGNVLVQGEPIHTGSPMLPVNWLGDGQEYALLSGNPREGGMIDGYLRRVVMFPDDGHPDLAANALDLTGDARDEIVLWDQRQVWIYTQDRPFSGPRIYAPMRNPDANESNYRTNVSLPRWKDVRR